MSITILIRYTGEKGSALSFATEMTQSGTVDDVRAEEGCERYEYFFPMDDPESVLLIDRWASQEAIDAHHKSPMMETIARLREKYHLCMKVERYTEMK